MITLEATLDGCEKKILLRFHDRDPNKLIEPYIRDEKVIAIDFICSIVHPTGKKNNRHYLQIAATMEITKEKGGDPA